MKPKLSALPIDQRPIPEAALRDDNACELLRLWIAENGLHCSMRVKGPNGTTDEVDWGIVLAASVRHLARALCHDESEVEDSIARIAEAFNQELGDPVAQAVESMERAEAGGMARPTIH